LGGKGEAGDGAFRVDIVRVESGFFIVFLDCPCLEWVRTRKVHAGGGRGGQGLAVTVSGRES